MSTRLPRYIFYDLVGSSHPLICKSIIMMLPLQIRW